MSEPKERRNTVGRRQEDKWQVWDKRIRDLIIWVIGVGALVNELFLKAEPNPATLIFLGGMIGVPFVLKADEVRRNQQ